MATVARRGIDKLFTVILAAGGSSRLGTPKQLARYKGLPLLQRAVGAAADATGRSPIVVLGSGALRLRAMLRRVHRHCNVVANPQWQSGLASSMRVGLDALPPDAEAVLFLLSDQPRVDAAGLRRLVAAWSRRPALPAAAAYAGRVGVPAIIPRRAWPLLRAQTGDTGARAVLQSAARITIVELPEAESDVDTPADLERLKGRMA